MKPRLLRVTMTGADDSTSVADLAKLSDEFPYCEWGILIGSRHGRPRFPSFEWFMSLRQEARRARKKPMQLSLHICGVYLRNLLMGKINEDVFTLIEPCGRAQLNTHAEDVEYDAEPLARALSDLSDEGQKEFIFQIDGNLGEVIMRRIFDLVQRGDKFSIAPLFDLSHGAGVLPKRWPDAMQGFVTGYAGGLGPDNLEEQLKLINERAGDSFYWIDMETKIRSDNDRVFDLDKVRRCLEIAKPYVWEE